MKYFDFFRKLVVSEYKYFFKFFKKYTYLYKLFFIPKNNTMVYLSCCDKNGKIKFIDFEDNHFLFQNQFIRLLDLNQPIHISYEILSYFKNINLEHKIRLNEITFVIDMLCFDLPTKKMIITPFIHKEFKNT